MKIPTNTKNSTRKLIQNVLVIIKIIFVVLLLLLFVYNMIKPMTDNSFIYSILLIIIFIIVSLPQIIDFWILKEKSRKVENSLYDDILDLETKLASEREKINNEQISKEEKEQLQKSITESNEQLNIIKAIVQESREKEYKIKLLNEKIRNAFQGIKQVNNSISIEHSRLNRLYLFYMIASISIVVALFVEVTCICYKIHSIQQYPNLIEYLPLMFPIPIALGLLYGFITQMNRAQIQMVQLAKEMRETNYTEELMLATNTLAKDLDEGIDKVNKAIDKLLEKNINTDSNVPKSMDCLCKLVENEGSVNIIVDILKNAIKILEKHKE